MVNSLFTRGRLFRDHWRSFEKARNSEARNENHLAFTIVILYRCRLINIQLYSDAAIGCCASGWINPCREMQSSDFCRVLTRLFFVGVRLAIWAACHSNLVMPWQNLQDVMAICGDVMAIWWCHSKLGWCHGNFSMSQQSGDVTAICKMSLKKFKHSQNSSSVS